MKTTILIPTRNRFKKLLRTFESIDLDEFEDLSVCFICDGDLNTYNWLEKNFREWARLDSDQVTILMSKQHVGSVRCRNYAINLLMLSEPRNILSGTDDISFKEGSIRKAMMDFEKRFPDTDGVVGFRQTGVPNFNPAGVSIIGKKFIERYPGHKVFCEEYFHFSVQELLWHAEKVNRFFLSTAEIFHHHPAFHKMERDETHVEARKWKDRDHRIMRERQRVNQIWGYQE